MVRMYVGSRLPPDYQPLGFFVATATHILVTLLLWYSPSLYETPLDESVVYSVTLEGGKTIGGRFQVGDDTKKQPPVPPKNVSSEKPPPPPQEESQEKKPISTPEPIEEPDVVKTGPEKNDPVPTPKSTVKPEPTLKPKPTSAPKATALPTVLPAVAPKVNKEKIEPPSKNTKRREKAENPEQDYQKAMQRYLGSSSDGGGSGFGAAKIGGSGTGGGIVRPPEFFTYLTMLKNRVKSGWRWFDSSSSYVATVEIEIETSGHIVRERIIRSSGNSEFDQSLLRAVRAADPLTPPPATVYQYFRITQIVFDPREY